MKIMSDFEALGLKLTVCILLITVAILLFVAPTHRQSHDNPVLVHDTIIVTKTDTIRDTVVKWYEKQPAVEIVAEEPIPTTTFNTNDNN